MSTAKKPDPQDHRPMRKGGDKQPDRPDIREHTQHQQHSDPRQRKNEQAQPGDRRDNDSHSQTEGAHDAQHKSGYR